MVYLPKTHSRMRSIWLAAPAASEESSTTNSSPPHRPTMSPERVYICSSMANCRSRSSPARCPYLSLTCLNPLRSIMMTENRILFSMQRCMRSSTLRRLATLVSSSFQNQILDRLQTRFVGGDFGAELLDELFAVARHLLHVGLKFVDAGHHRGTNLREVVEVSDGFETFGEVLEVAGGPRAMAHLSHI